MFLTLLKAYLIGIIAPAPLGPAAILVLQKSLSEGRKSGMIAGIGTCTVDTTWATLSVFALAIARKFLETYQTAILIVGGIVVAAVGISMATSDPFKKAKISSSDGSIVRGYIQAVATAASNPGAILVMMALFTFFGISNLPHDATVIPVILSVSAGSISYWFCFTTLFSRIGKRLNLNIIKRVNQISGLLILGIAAFVFAKGIINLISL